MVLWGNGENIYGEMVLLKNGEMVQWWYNKIMLRLNGETVWWIEPDMCYYCT